MRRDSDGELIDAFSKTSRAKNTHRELLVSIQVDRHTGVKELQALEQSLLHVLEDVSMVVEDFDAMTEKCDALTEDFAKGVIGFESGITD
jgi:glutamate dehydrogenase